MKPSSQLWRFVRRLGALVVLLLIALGISAWYKLFRKVPLRYEAIEEQFKYGSIGTEADEGIPYWIWLVLPRVFPNHLPGPGGYTSLGIVWEEGHEMPVGFTKMTIGFPRVGINCSLCHSGTYRTDSQQSPILVPGAPATRINVLGYERFLFACASDPRFNSENILAAIEYNTKLSTADKLLYSLVLIPQTRKALQESSKRFGWTKSRPDWGRGRIDPFNPVKFHQLGMDSGKDDSIGNSDMEPIWNLQVRTGHLHWDGLNDSIAEVVYSGAIGDGATTKSLPVDDLNRIQAWLTQLQPPRYPYPVDAVKAAKGQTIYEHKCAICHSGARTGTVIPYSEIQTDHHRIDMWSQDAANIYNSKTSIPGQAFSHFEKHNGYVAVPLDGLWLRAPYLHNGSVPTLEDLLEPANRRPKIFYRGYDVYDRTTVGFLHSGAEAQREGWRFDVSVPGNSNQGHDGEPFGTQLTAEQKQQLVEYLKTL